MRLLKKYFKSILTQNVHNFVKFQSRQAHSEAKQAVREFFPARHCMSLVEKNDHENYLCTLLLNKEQRRHVFALRAFNVEVAKSGINATEQQIAQMRLKFWHDSIDKCFDTKRSYVEDHPVLLELKNAIDSNKLTKIYLKRLVTARNRAPNEPFIVLQDLENYAEQAFSSLYFLIVELFGVRDLQIDHAISHLGKAQGIATLLRAIPYTGRTHAICVPHEILIKHGVSQERILRDSDNDKGVEDCIFEVATAAFQHLEQARNLCDKVPKNLRKLFLPAVSVDRYLERLRKANFRISHASCQQRDAMLPMSLYWHSFRNKY